MPLQNLFEITADLKKTTHLKEPHVMQNDDITFVVSIKDNELDFLLTDVTTATLANARLDKVTIVTPGVISLVDKTVTFNLGTNETAVTGRVDATVQLYDVSGRVSTVNFSYKVSKDPTGSGFIPSEVEQTLIQVVLNDGPLRIQEAIDAGVFATDQGDYAKAQGDYVESQKPIIDTFTGEQTNLQSQINVLVVDGDSSPESAQARVGSDAIIYPTLKARLDAEENKTTTLLADKVDEAELFGDANPKNTKFLFPMASYIGILNDLFQADNATRIYVLPKAAVTTGVGGAIKIFGDPFHLDQANYRDLGLYFSQDQNGELGFNGDGAFYMNSKAVGTKYAKNPDLVFSFQDAHIGGRFVYLANGGNPKMCFVVGKGLPQIFSATNFGIAQELQGDLALRNNDMIRWVNTSGLPTSGIRYNVDNDLEFLIGNTSVLKIKNTGKGINRAKIEGIIVQGTKTITDNSVALDVSGANAISVGNSATTKITSLTGGLSGQETTLIFTNAQTTIENNATIKLQGGVNYVPTQYSTLKLIFLGTIWYETARSVNS